MRPVPAPLALFVAASFLGATTAGCLSNEYRLPRDELVRLAELPPAARGERVHVVQEIGERRESPVEPGQPLPAPPPPEAIEAPAPPPEVAYDIQIDGNYGYAHGPVPVRAPVAPRLVHAAPPAPAAPRPAAPVAAPTHARAVPRTGSSGGFNLPVPSGGGKGDELVVLAVIVVVVAVMAATGLIVTEGVRFDGFVAMAPAQPLHLRDAGGGERVVALGDLSREDAAHADGALVMDDEGWGLRRLDRGPLRRRGLSFKMDVGMAGFALERYDVTGLASHIQAGGFFNDRFGLMLDLGLSGATDAGANDLARHSLALEAQVFPVIAGPLSLGLYAQGGQALAAGPTFSDSGLLGGGGALIELALTARLALTLRAGWTAVRLDNIGWSQGGTVTAGVAIY